MSRFIISITNTKYWYNDKDQLHRDDGPAIEYEDGDKFWYQNDEFHREDGPALELSNGDTEWYINGSLHREDGPAIEFSDGTKEWFYHGEKINCQIQEDFLRIIKMKAFW